MTNRKPNRLRVGVIGLGTIGSRAAANLRAAGHQVYVWNRTPRAEPNFLGSPGEVTDLCDALQLFVSDDAALLETVRAVAPALKPRHLVLAHPTVSPEAAREAAAIVEKTGARYVDAPFTGSRAAAGNGQLVYYVSAPEPARRDALPVLEATSKAVVVIGDDVGQAAATKIATNLLAAAIVQSLSEALALVRAAGVQDARFAEAMENNGSRSGITDAKLPAMLRGEHTPPHFALKHMLKDARLALALAAGHGLTLPATATVAAQLYGANRRGWGELDFAALAKNYDPAPPAPAVPPTVIPETLPPTPVAPPPPPAARPTPPLALGLPDLPGEETRSPLVETPIPRAGLPFPPGEEPAPPAGADPAPEEGVPHPLPDPGADPGEPLLPRGGLPFPPAEPPAPAPEMGTSPVETPAPSEGDLPLPADGSAPPPGSRPSPAPPEEKPGSAPDPTPEPAPPTQPGPPRPPATRRTLLSWFQKEK